MAMNATNGKEVMITMFRQAFRANFRLFSPTKAKPTVIHKKNGRHRSQARNNPNSNVICTNSPTSKSGKRKPARIIMIPNILVRFLSKMKTYPIFLPLKARAHILRPRDFQSDLHFKACLLFSAGSK